MRVRLSPCAHLVLSSLQLPSLQQWLAFLLPILLKPDHPLTSPFAFCCLHLPSLQAGLSWK